MEDLMNWIKTIRLLFSLLILVGTPTMWASEFLSGMSDLDTQQLEQILEKEKPAQGTTQQETKRSTALTTVSKSKDKKDDKQQSNSWSSYFPGWRPFGKKKETAAPKGAWLSMDNNLKVTPEFQQSISTLIFQIKEMIQGPSELKSLLTIQLHIAQLAREIQEIKSKSTTQHVINESERKRSVSDAESKDASAAAHLSLSSEPDSIQVCKKFIQEKIKPTISQIDTTLKELQNRIKQRIDAYTAEQNKAAEEADKENKAKSSEQETKELAQEALILPSLTEKRDSLEKIAGRFRIIMELTSPDTLITAPAVIYNNLAKELTTLDQIINKEIEHFKGGLAGVFDDTIKDLSIAGKSISANIADDLQRNLRAALGSSEIIRRIEDIDTWLLNYRPDRMHTYKVGDAIAGIVGHVQELKKILNNINQSNPEKADIRLGEIIGQFESALTQYQSAIKQGAGSEKSAHAALYALHATICRTNTELLHHLQGTLANIIHELRDKLFDVVDRFNAGFQYTIDQNMNKFTTATDRLDTTINTVNRDLPRTLRKGIGYLTLGTIAACAVCHIIWHDRPWTAHLKNIGLATGSLLGMFFVDPVIDYFSRPRPARARV